MSDPNPTPVTLLTGFLGSGKTTLLNRLLAHLPRTAVIMNEFGEIALDHHLLGKAQGPLALLSNGCVCCTVQGMLSPALKNLFMGRANGSLPAFERVILETTGIADPTTIIDTLMHERWVAARYRLTAVVTTVDAVLGEQQLDSYFEAVRQVACADRLLITKTDLAGPDGVAALKARLTTINPGAELLEVVCGEVDPAKVVAGEAYDPAAKGTDLRRWLAESRFKPITVTARLGQRAAGPVHDHRVRSFSVAFDEPLEWLGLFAALQRLIHARSKYLLRMKALVNLRGRNTPAVLHAVQHVLYPLVQLPEWSGEDRRSRFVFIVADLDEAAVAQMLAEFSSAARATGASGME